MNKKFKVKVISISLIFFCFFAILAIVDNLILRIANLKKNNSYHLIEKYIPGREIQVAIKGNKKLGTIELVPKRQFYDYKAKYDKKAQTQHILPVDLPKKKIGTNRKYCSKGT